MENENHSSIIGITENLLKSFSSGGTDDMKTSLKHLKDQVVDSLNEDPIRTIGVAFSLGFAATKMMGSSGPGLQKKLAQAVGSALVYGLVNPMLKSDSSSANSNIH